MPELELGGTTVVVEVPGPAAITMAPPSSPGVLVVPVVGPPGAAGGSFSYTQAVPASTWTIHHNLGTRPVPVILLDTDPLAPVWTDMQYVDANTLVLTFPTPVTGRAYL